MYHRSMTTRVARSSSLLAGCWTRRHQRRQPSGQVRHEKGRPARWRIFSGLPQWFLKSSFKRLIAIAKSMTVGEVLRAYRPSNENVFSVELTQTLKAILHEQHACWYWRVYFYQPWHWDYCPMEPSFYLSTACPNHLSLSVSSLSPTYCL